MVYFLLISLILYCIVAYWLTNKSLFSPPVLAGGMFAVGCLFLTYNLSYWGVDLSGDTYGIIIGGLLLFLFVFVAITYKSPRRKFLNGNTDTRIETIKLHPFFYYGAILFTILSFALYLRNILKIASFFGANGSVAEKLAAYRYYSSHTTLTSGSSAQMAVGGLEYWLHLIVESSAYVWVYIFVNNWFSEKEKNKWIVAIIALSIANSLLTGGRLDIARIPLSFLIIYSAYWYRLNSKRFKLPTKFIRKIVIVFISILFSFVIARNILGRTSVGYRSATDPIYYLSIYLGGPIALLDLFLKTPPEASDIWGKETFAGTLRNIGKFFNKPELTYVTHKEYRYYQGISLGNVYTAFRSYIYDFGIIGMIILVAVMAIIFGLMYRHVMYGRKKNGIDVTLIFYSYWCFAAAMMFYADYFFERFFTQATFRFIVILFIWKLYIKYKRRIVFRR